MLYDVRCPLCRVVLTGCNPSLVVSPHRYRRHSFVCHPKQVTLTSTDGAQVRLTVHGNRRQSTPILVAQPLRYLNGLPCHRIELVQRIVHVLEDQPLVVHVERDTSPGCCLTTLWKRLTA